MDPVRLAIIGAGGIGARHIELAVQEADCELTAIVDPAPETKKLPHAVGVAHYSEPTAMLQAGLAEAAIIATPNALHAPMGELCAAHGLHILVEKPIAETVAAGRRLVAAADASGVHLLVGHMRRYDPAVEKARDMLRSGEIGQLLAVQATWALQKPDAYFEIAWRRQDGGGPVLLNLIHDIDCLRYICGEIASVYAETSNSVRGFEVEDTAAIVLRFRGGALGTVTVSAAAPSPWGWERATGENPIIPATGENCFRFIGTTGALDFPGLQLWRHDGPEPAGWHQSVRLVSTAAVTERASLAAQLAHFCRVVRGVEAPRIAGADGLGTLAATMAVLESARRRVPVSPQYFETGDS